MSANTSIDVWANHPTPILMKEIHILTCSVTHPKVGQPGQMKVCSKSIYVLSSAIIEAQDN